MKNYVKEGQTITVTAPYNVLSGGLLLKGTHFVGVATSDALSGAEVEAITTGVVNVAKTSALAISVGDAVYLDNAAKVVNKTAAAQKQVGIAVSDAANPSATVWVRLTPNGMLYP